MGRDHILLIGIDAYRGVDPLYGAANDVDALEETLVHRLGVSSNAITKLVARHGASRTDEQQPTLANLRRSLESLTGDLVTPGDRVFIHYSGHGARVESRGRYAIREALVPVDVGEAGSVLFDYEMNDVLRRIALRTEDVTVIMDCCFSAGTTRGAFPAGRRRSCRVDGIVRSADELANHGMLSTMDPSDPGYLVVASAQSSEPALEVRDASGVWRGAFMAAFLEVVARPFDGGIGRLRWVDVWPLLRAAVSSMAPGQHPCLIGRSERRVFGGPYRRGDPGLSLTKDGDEYRIGVGSLAGLGRDAEIGVYAAEPSYFEPLGSAKDIRSRRGVLRVRSVDATSATAVAVGPALSLELGARGRLIKPGNAERLVVGMDPFHDDTARYLESEAHVKVVTLDSANVEVVVRQSPDGRWFIGDEVFGADAPLGWVDRGDIVALARGLLHYARYNQLLRLARRSLDGGSRLRLMVLDAKRVSSLRREELADPPLGEAKLDLDGGCTYRLHDGQAVCFSVWNRWSRPLYVHLFNCASSGMVEGLGTPQVEILPAKRYVFWMGGHMGEPFRACISPGREWNVDRLVAVGTVSPDVDLSCLQVRENLADAMKATHRGERLEEVTTLEWDARCVKARIVRG